MLAFLHPYFRRILAKKTKGRKTENSIYIAMLSKLFCKNQNKTEKPQNSTCTVSLTWMYGPVEDMTVIENYTGETCSVLWANLVQLLFFGALHAARAAC